MSGYGMAEMSLQNGELFDICLTWKCVYILHEFFSTFVAECIYKKIQLVWGLDFAIREWDVGRPKKNKSIEQVLCSSIIEKETNSYTCKCVYEDSIFDV